MWYHNHYDKILIKKSTSDRVSAGISISL